MEIDKKIELQKFQAYLNKDPNKDELSKTPDGKAWDLSISFIEMTLDELYFGLWSTENFRWSCLQNEIQGAIDLKVKHPINNEWICRTGAASIVITVDALSDDQKNSMSKAEKNLYALNLENKKPNALDLAFPKLKAECLKNAAKSLGKIFGRDLNRKLIDSFKPLLTKPIDTKQVELTKQINRAVNAINEATSISEIDNNPELIEFIYENNELLKLYQQKKEELKNN